MRTYFAIAALLWAGILGATDIKVRLFSDISISNATLLPDSGNYYLIALDSDMQPIDTVLDIFDEEEHKTLNFTQRGSSVSAYRGDFPAGSYHGLLVRTKQPFAEFQIRAGGKHRIYQGDLQVRVFEGALQVVNIVDLEQYVAGVVESEGGHILSPEYFKAQAVLARTFALKNWDKHADEGYNLKDDVTSQVYFSKARHQYSSEILEAVKATRDTIVVTYRCDPILGVFHANSGGYCTNADDVWLKEVDYLKQRVDTFSIGVGSYLWERRINKNDFYNYYARKLGVANDAFLRKAILNFKQPPRQAYFEYKGRSLKLTHVRKAFNLRSTFFSVEEVGNQVILNGRGYGHGVGLSQDGAMEMARRGYNYHQIINYYYDGVELENVKMLRLDL